ncbi:RluA family pseudouridine synthase [Melissococcus plutonius]|uniref:Pseudouridine synthase n=1 Tax=Melissococcus plutonius (strain ATCC 35311 / DSM 29964 / CIP 104052 / LMG 20360 / NCIMB 702443) TaxID=940190 RepID=F3YAT8_MELPT|nr:RluA family pseudouridine synthase [Melissococcus plutonius]KMT32409.1 pseudouridine synthase [Melissococcus plutonius]KMT34122.1 pseudouridine synthase [Melissococcus plutonius]KMT39915.1 pseudouridine synthase [Melissococcus plutonius]MBB5178426.1 23S rRNA pseudouridine1911/1915/1917 synthase [Melissococcus plutonius]BAK21616.1 ribosomal large subunit pseudouridine synthase D [Melissococcus plutonius ATCC 35311]
MENIKLIITEKTIGRIDKVLSEELIAYSRSQIQQWLKDSLVRVNNKVVKANYKVQPADEVIIQLPKPKMMVVSPENIPLDIVYEDQDVVVINKPQGMVVHPSAGHFKGTMVHALLYHIKDLSSINDVIRPGIVHRIDKDTSGLLIVAKNNQAHEALAKQLKDKTILRKYIALVHGEVPHEQGTIDAPIGRSKTNRKMQAIIKDGRSAVTHFKVLEKFTGYTLIELQLETGRTHQIRVHMKYIGHPVAGDPVYGPKKTLKGEGQFLHAKVLGFTHPTTHERMVFEAPLPEIFQNTLTKLRINH